jgi:hypothetical protein
MKLYVYRKGDCASFKNVGLKMLEERIKLLEGDAFGIGEEVEEAPAEAVALS